MSQITPYFKYFVTAAIILSVAFVVSQVVRRILKGIVNDYSDKIKANPTNFSFINNSISFIIYSTAVLFIFLKIPFLKQIGAALFAGAGVFAAIIGFASQKAFSNIISGIFILMFKPFRVGDVVEVSGGKSGTVEEITLRHTTIRNFENKRIIIPNSVISDDTIVNSDYVDERIRKYIEFNLDYEANIDRALEIIAEEVIKHPLFLDGRNHEQVMHKEPLVQTKVVALTDYSVKVRAWVWANNSDDAFILYCDVLKSVKERLGKEKIPLAYIKDSSIHKSATLPNVML